VDPSRRRHTSRVNSQHWSSAMKILMWIVGIIFLIGLLVVLGLGAAIF
jgi:uncharacterized membrane protein affecting hemolysin expression